MSAVCCQVEVSATSWSLAQRSATDYSVSLYAIYEHQELRCHDPRWAAAIVEEKKFKNSSFNLFINNEGATLTVLLISERILGFI